MDLLGLSNYGSDSEQEEETPQEPLQAPGISMPTISAAPDEPQPTKAPEHNAPSAPQSASMGQRMELQPAQMPMFQDGPPEIGPTRAQVGPSFPESEVPAPSKQSVWSSLPMPKTKRVVQLNLPFNKAMLKAAEREDEEDAAAAKKRKPNPAKSKLTDLLPAPRNGYAPVGGSRLALGSGEGGAIDLTTTSSSIPQQKQGGRQSKRADSDDEDPMAKFGPMPEAGDFATGPTEDDNETALSAAPGVDDSAWMMGQQLQYGYEGALDYRQYGAAQQHGPAPEQYEAGAYYVGAQPEYADYADPAATSGDPSTSLPAQLATQGQEDPGQALFAQALMEEQERASKKGKGMDLSGIQFKEVNQKDLTYVPAAAREAATNVRSALGPEYAAKLRSDAKPFEGDRLSKRKHQIGTLFYNAKMKELEIMEGKAHGMAQKGATAAKYGW
ncbi:hypothetical protein DUNSADRAFT_5078 [Dunaliella salina]|uniref:Proline-rich protein PRCC n=1 Tax=Dunaliella salina TaxID=3046 RepID=A0ABQ7HAG6_DUNSA|nr:hypothetical protein DUNSADRAFT_5078 [Dunaliella salina]|eukprot:KAF5843841.1 hypothetical protein DUNSADRAFT_5078 [Dunaliella salina]